LARGAQGIAAALLVPGSLSIIGASFLERERGKAIGIWSGATAITGAIGPMLGGWLIDHFSWRAAFFINVPLAIVVLVAAIRHVPESKNSQTKGSLDWPGAILATLGLGGVVYGLIESPAKGWTNTGVSSALFLGLAFLACFVIVESRRAAPMIPLGLFRSKTFLGANLLTLMLYGALGGSLFFIPLNLIQVQGYSATAAGAAMLPFIVLMAILSRWSGGLIDRYGARRPLIVGPLIAAVGFAMFAIPHGGNYWIAFFPAILVLGLGMAITVAPLTTAVLNSVDSAFEGAASGINNAASRIAIVVAIAVFGIIFAFAFNASLANNLRRAQSPPAITQIVEQQRDKLAAIELPANLEAGVKAAAQHAIAEAFIAGYRWIMVISALLALASGVFAWLLVENLSGREKNQPA
jgi:EmrB/QacA subfamily drug resistance transporter